MTDPSHPRHRWLALMVLCAGVQMIVLDTTIVNVALLSIRADLGFSETSLVWVVNAYMLTFGGFMLLAISLAIESRVEHPLMPLALFRLCNLATANVVGVLWAAAMFAWFFISALYLQLVLGYSAMQVGLAFLPANLIMAAFSLGLSARIVMRFGIRAPLVAGLLVGACGLLLFARAPSDGQMLLDVMPGLLLLGLGSGIAFNPLLLAAMSDVAPSESGLASGVVNTAFMMGGALGLAVLASLASARSEALTAAGATLPVALNGGYHLAFIVGTGFALAAAGLAALLLRPGVHQAQPSAGGRAAINTPLTE